MFILKHLKTCYDLIQIIFRELICSLLKLLILKFVKNVKVNVVMLPHHHIHQQLLNSPSQITKTSKLAG